jgi:hypothetical protein
LTYFKPIVLNLRHLKKELKFQNDESRICLFFISSISNKFFFVAKNSFYLCGQNSFRLDLIIKLIWFFFQNIFIWVKPFDEKDWLAFIVCSLSSLFNSLTKLTVFTKRDKKSENLAPKQKNKKQTKDCQTLLYGRLSNSISILIQFCFSFSFTQSWDLTLILKSNTTSSDFVLW